MLTLLGFEIVLPPGLFFLQTPLIAFALNALAWGGIAFVVNLIFSKVLKTVARDLPGEVADILAGILRRPLLILIMLYGAVSSLKLLPLPAWLGAFIERVAYSTLTLVVLHLVGRVIKDVVVYYGEKMARKTESRVDDVVVPLLNLFGPIVIALIGALIILPLWGINVTSVLLGAGVAGLVLGLALQETLSNVFSGMSLLVEAPFKNGDLVVLPDGRICQVERLGLRSTQFYSVDEHSTIYVPNKVLSGATLVNITKPTVEQKYSIEVQVGLTANLGHVQETLRRTALAHPSVLTARMEQKIPLLRERIAFSRKRAHMLEGYDPVREKLLTEAERYEAAIPRLEKEDEVNRQLLQFEDVLRKLIRGIMIREGQGLNPSEIQELVCRYVTPADEEIEKLMTMAKDWTAIQDPWVNDRDFWDDRKLWDIRNEQLRQRWERVKREIHHPKEHMELRIDDLVKELLDWIKVEYKVVPGDWKEPEVSFKKFDGSSALLQVWFFVDNIRLEHDGRGRRVKTEIARHIREQFVDEGIW